MYSVVFESDNGNQYIFGKEGNTIFDMDLGEGVSVNLGTAQGFSQVGETVESQTVKGRTIKVKGVVFGNIVAKKKEMRDVISPFAVGRLVFNNEYFTRVYVKSAPSFSSVRNDGRFTIQFFAPFPFFYNLLERSGAIGDVTPMFHFPVNYAYPHKFGERGTGGYTNIVNSGNVKIPFDLTFTTSGTSSGIVVTNLETFDFLKINGSILIGDVLKIYHDENNVVKAELNRNGVVNDVISWIDEESTLFQLNIGNNYISASDNEGGMSLTTRFSYRTAVGAVYES